MKEFDEVEAKERVFKGMNDEEKLMKKSKDATKQAFH